MSKHGFHHIRFEQVIGIQHLDKLTCYQVEPVISCSCSTLVFLMDNLDTCITCGVFIQNGGGVIFRPVVDQDDFQVAVGLVADGIQRGTQELCCIVDRTTMDTSGESDMGRGR